MREGAVIPPGRFARFRVVGAILLAALGFALVLIGLFVAHGTAGVLLSMLIGALLVFIGVSLFASQLVRPLASVLGWPAARLGGVAGGLARDNAQRNPQRTASTASALMIGLALVTLVAVLAAGIIKPFQDAVDQLFTADYAITAQNNFDPIPPSAASAAAKTPGVETIASVRGGDGLVVLTPGKGSTIQVTGVEPGISKVISLDWQDGSPTTIDNLGADGAVVSKAYAKDHNLKVGSPITVISPTGGVLALTLKGIFAPPTGGSPFGTVTISSSTFDQNWQQPLNIFTFVKMQGGVTDANTAALNESLKAFPNAKAQTRKEFTDNQIAGFKQVLNILYVLLALSIVVSVFGIVNTLVLTVYERTREIGMLRAIGLTRRQTRRMIRHESVITALIGARSWDRPRARARRPAGRPREGDRVRDPVDATHHLRDRVDLRRHPRRDLPGPARREARPARGAAVRVGRGEASCVRAARRRPRSAAAATAVATASATSRLNTLGITYSGPSSSSAITDAIAWPAATFMPSVIVLARTSSAPRKTPGKASTLLIWFG